MNKDDRGWPSTNLWTKRCAREQEHQLGGQDGGEIFPDDGKPMGFHTDKRRPSLGGVVLGSEERCKFAYNSFIHLL